MPDDDAMPFWFVDTFAFGVVVVFGRSLITLFPVEFVRLVLPARIRFGPRGVRVGE